MIQTLAIVSAAGGSGRTTFAATLASLLSGRGHPVLAIDFDPRNNLGMQLGMPLDQSDGLAPLLLAQSGWHQAAFQNSDGVRLIPFGRVPAERLPALEGALLKSPHWLREQLEKLDLGDDACVLIDTPRLPSQNAIQAIGAADLVLDVLLPDASAYEAARNVVAVAGYERTYHVLNHLDANRQLQRDVLQLLRARLGSRLAPYSIHRDESVPEAVASNCSLSAYAPNGQAAHDFQGLASWLLGLLRQRAAVA